MQSALYKGSVFHSRFVPKKHAFTYQIFLLWLNLDEIDLLEAEVKGFSTKSWAALRFKRSDYLGNANIPLKKSVIDKMSELAQRPLSGTIYLLGQTRTFGLYFSPVNFYYLQQKNAISRLRCKQCHAMNPDLQANKGRDVSDEATTEEISLSLHSFFLAIA